MSKSPVTLVVFDLGRVLLRICDNWEHACDVAGVPRPQVSAELDATERDRAKEIIEQYDSGKIDLPQFAKKIAPFRGLDPSHVVALSDAYLLGPYEGVSELLEELKSRGVRTACLSNTTATHWDRVLDPADKNFLPMHLMNHLFASHLVGMCKPNDAIYAHVESETGASGGSIVFFDDLEENIGGAAARGWRAIRIDIDQDPISQVRKHLASLGILG